MKFTIVGVPGVLSRARSESLPPLRRERVFSPTRPSGIKRCYSLDEKLCKTRPASVIIFGPILQNLKKPAELLAIRYFTELLRRGPTGPKRHIYFAPRYQHRS